MKKKEFFILGITVFCLIIFIGYNFIFKSEKNDDNNILSSNINIYYNKLKENRTYLELRSGRNANLLLDKNGNVYYKAPVDNISKELLNKMRDYSFDDYRSGAGEPYVYRSVKLNVSNVLMMYYGENIIDSVTYYVLLKDNGQVAIAGFKGKVLNTDDYTYDLQLVYFKDNVSGLKNIVTVIQDDSYDLYNTLLFDINGNSYRLADYLK